MQFDHAETLKHNPDDDDNNNRLSLATQKRKTGDLQRGKRRCVLIAGRNSLLSYRHLLPIGIDFQTCCQFPSYRDAGHRKETKDRLPRISTTANEEPVRGCSS